MTIPPWQFQRQATPELIKRLLQITTAVTFLAVALDPWLGLQSYLALSPLAYERLFFWQPLTSIFLIPSAVFSLGFVIDFAFAMLILWLFGSSLLDRIGKKRFLIAYFGSGLISGCAALIVMHAVHGFAMLSSCLPVLLALTTLWTMADPYQELLLFFVLPLKAKWILVLALCGTILASLLQQDLVSVAAYGTAFLFSYIYGLQVLRFRSPFDWMTKIDRFFHWLNRTWQWYVLGSFRKLRESLFRARGARKAKEEAFLDATLDKISRSGTSSLSLYERLRLKWISFKKR